jgi:hypothetical protein
MTRNVMAMIQAASTRHVIHPLTIKYIQSIPMHTSIVIRVGNTKQQTKVLRKASSVTLSLCFALDKIKAITIPTKAINCVCQQLCSIGTADMDVQ